MIAKFIKSASKLEECPESSLPEVGFVGRSNAGKSSLINAITKHKNIARVSSAPGKTDLLNFYEIDSKFMLVDMPGYGYATRHQDLKESWTPMIESFLQHRENLKGVVLVADIKRPWGKDEENLVGWLANYGLPVVVAANKIDKLNQKDLSAKKREFDAIDGVSTTIYTSSTKHTGIDNLLRTVFDKIIRT